MRDKPRRRRLAANIAAADLLTVSTGPLAEEAQKLTSAPVLVLPNYIDPGLLCRQRGEIDGSSVSVISEE